MKYSKLYFLIVRRTGAAIPPYDYMGFVATIEFIDDIVTLSTSTTSTLEVSPYPAVAVSSKRKLDIIITRNQNYTII